MQAACPNTGLTKPATWIEGSTYLMYRTYKYKIIQYRGKQQQNYMSQIRG